MCVVYIYILCVAHVCGVCMWCAFMYVYVSRAEQLINNCDYRETIDF